MYYILECYGPEDEDRASLGKWPTFQDVNWNLGRLIDKDKVQTPIEVELDPQFPGIMMPMFYSGVLMFNEEMIHALQDAGVNNFQWFDAVIKDPTTGKVYENYKVINIVGLVACADLGNSKYDAHGNVPLVDTDFDSLVIDESKTYGLLFFRLAEAVNAIVVHEDVKKSLEAHNIPYLDFIEPENWIG